MEVPFYCPICNGDKAILIQNVIMATPYEPTIQCNECKQLWRINLYEVAAVLEESMKDLNIDDKVIVIEGSSDGHTGKIILVRPNGGIRVVRDNDGVEVDIPKGNYAVLRKDIRIVRDDEEKL